MKECTRLGLWGNELEVIPPEIGDMRSLQVDSELLEVYILSLRSHCFNVFASHVCRLSIIETCAAVSGTTKFMSFAGTVAREE